MSSFLIKIKKKIGKKNKDETAGMPIKEFTGHRSKVYSYNTGPTKFFSTFEKLTEDTIEDKKKCETLKNTQLIKSPPLSLAEFWQVCSNVNPKMTLT